MLAGSSRSMVASNTLVYPLEVKTAPWSFARSVRVASPPSIRKMGTSTTAYRTTNARTVAASESPVASRAWSRMTRGASWSAWGSHALHDEACAGPSVSDAQGSWAFSSTLMKPGSILARASRSQGTRPS